MSKKALREGLGLFAVVAGLVFVGWEIRQNTTVARAATYQDIGFNVLETWREIAHNPEMTSLIVTARDTMRWPEITESEWLQLAAVQVAAMRGWEAIYRQVEEGLLPPDAVTQFGYGVELRPWQIEVWPDVRRTLPPDFATFVAEHYGLE